MNYNEQFKILDELISRIITDIDDNTILYHYTDAGSLINIITNKEIWISQREFMNDKLEMYYPMNEMIDIVKKRDNINLLLLEGEMEKFKQYVFSLSLDGDSLNHWLSYGKNDGYCIGFKKRQLVTMFNNKELSYIHGKVIYNLDDYKLIINNILEVIEKCYQEIYIQNYVNTDDKLNNGKLDTEEIFRYGFSINGKISFSSKVADDFYKCGSIFNNLEIKNEILSKYNNILDKIFYLMKHECNRHENEYRFVVKNHDDIHFRNRRGIIVPFIKLEFEKLLIDQIIIGPKINDEISFSGLKQLCLVNNLKSINIKKSNLNIR